MSYRVLSRDAGRREVRRVDLPVVPWTPMSGGYYGWGYTSKLGVPDWEVQDPNTYSPRLVWAPVYLKQIVAFYGGALAQGADNRLYYWGDFPFVDSQFQPTLHPFDPGEPVKIHVLEGLYWGMPIFLIGLESGRVWCLGTNDFGQLGLGIADFSYVAETFTEVPLLRGFAKIGVFMAGRNVNPIPTFPVLCVYGVHGNDMYLWGDFVESGPSAPALYQRFSYPVVDVASPDTDRSNCERPSCWGALITLSNGDVYFRGTSDTGAALAIGFHEDSRLFTLTKHPHLSGVKKILKLGPEFIDITHSESRCVALKSDGSIWCWGYVTLYTDGTSRDEFVYTPIRIPGLSKIADIAANLDVLFALDAHGDVWVWGGRAGYADARRGLGEGAPVNVPPQKIPGMPMISALGTPSSAAFAIPKSSIPIEKPVRPGGEADLESIAWLWDEWNWAPEEGWPTNWPWGEAHPWLGGDAAPLPAGYTDKPDWSWLWTWDWQMTEEGPENIPWGDAHPWKVPEM